MWYYIYSTIFLKLNVEVRSKPLQNFVADELTFFYSFKILNVLYDGLSKDPQLLTFAWIANEATSPTLVPLGVSIGQKRP